MLQKPLKKMSLWELRDWFGINQEKLSARETAEITYVLAVGIKREADKFGPGFADTAREYHAMAQEYAARCAKTLSALPNRALADVATTHTTLGDVALPNYLYHDYVVQKSELKKYFA